MLFFATTVAASGCIVEIMGGCYLTNNVVLVGLFDVYERSRVDCEAEECFGYGPVASFPRLQVRPLWFRIITLVYAQRLTSILLRVPLRRVTGTEMRDSLLFERAAS